MRTVVVNEPGANNRRAFFQISLLDNTPALLEAGGQPQYQLNGGGSQVTGFGTLVFFGPGQYYADFSPTVFTTVGDVITTSFIHNGVTLPSFGDTFNVVSGTGSGLPPIPAAAYNSYVSVFQADTYFQSRLNSEVWFGTDPNTKLTALRQATRLIDALNFLGDKAEDTQPLQFPRGWTVETLVPGDNFTTGALGLIVTETGQDVVIPTDIQIACCEIALKLLEGVDPDLELEAYSTESQGYASVKTSYNRKFASEHLQAGIPSALAWRLLFPYLRDPLVINISRDG